MQISDAISAFHQTAPPPALGPLVVEQPSRSLTAERYDARTSARLHAFEQQVVGFHQAGDELLGRLRAAERSADGSADIADLSGLIDYLERTAEASAKGEARDDKDVARLVRRVERDDPTLGQAVRRAAAWQSELMRGLIERYLALALQLRAFRSELSPDGPAPTFDDPEDLTRYLERALRP